MRLNRLSRSYSWGGVVSIDDFDGDGDTDILAVVGHSLEHNVALFLNTGERANWSYREIGIGRDLPPPASVVDWDGDGDTDILLVGRDRSISWMDNNGVGVFGPPQSITTMSQQISIIGIHAADFDGDFDMDLLTLSGRFASPGGAGIVWYENSGRGEFTPSDSHPTRFTLP